ncbi:MarR family transcriptional regulator [Paenibacillus motobuensis]|uniref:MarR family winged helix-turn-helix transcriptional regulator n=1 Tax=Paenibacillus TaxID=44249 RepID=UPI00203B1F62|nr:MarR family transcriptional regulator [Paenibacillus lutimineralis]MCM3646385.1 MarR family transcriptional regulator [Paenibacillus motobuensis]
MNNHNLDKIELELAILYRRITNRKHEVLDRSAYILIHQIMAHGKAGVKTLADEFHLDISTVSRQVSSLEEKGYVLRTPDPSDGRAFFLEVTELGQQKFQEARTARQERIGNLLKDWSNEEAEQFGALLQKLNRTFN